MLTKVILCDIIQVKEECYMKKQYEINIEEDIYSRFQMAATIANQSMNEAIEACFCKYISETFANVSREYSTGEAQENNYQRTDNDYWYGKANQRIPQWAMKPTQYNHKIIRAFLIAEEMYGDVALEDLENLCTNPQRTDLYVPTFRNNYAQMKSDGPKTHGKVFEDDGTYVTVWSEVENMLRQYQHQFMRDASAEVTPAVEKKLRDYNNLDYNDLWNQIVNEFAENPRDVQTKPKGNRMPLWFYVSCKNGNVQISSGRTHDNKSNIRALRTLKKEEIEDIFTLYLRRKNDENVSFEATQTSQNQVYWYGIFAELGY